MLLRGKAARLRDSGRKLVLAAWAAMEQGHPLQRAVSLALEEIPLEGQRRRQAVDLVYNTVRMEVRCECVLSTVFPRFGRFPKPVRTLLLAAAASLLFQERVPAWAVINETVSEVRHFAGSAAASAVNAGLRALTRLGDDPKTLEFYKRAGDKDDYRAFLRYASVPLELGELVRGELGEERARTILGKSLERPRSVVRLNPMAAGFESLRLFLLAHGAVPLPGSAGTCGLDVSALRDYDEGREKTRILPGAMDGLESRPHDGLRASRHGELQGKLQGNLHGEALRELSARGLLSFQSAGSQLALAAFDLPALGSPDTPWWDMCAGFGGKTCAMLEKGLCVTLATDISGRRLQGLPKECERLGLACPKTVLADGTLPPLAGWSGNILLDVPCSGLGVLSRRPDIKRRLPDIAAHVAAQKALLSSAARLILPGAHLVYVTCTVTCSENADVVQWAAKELGLVCEGEWSTPLESPHEDMYAALLRKA